MWFTADTFFCFVSEISEMFRGPVPRAFQFLRRRMSPNNGRKYTGLLTAVPEKRLFEFLYRKESAFWFPLIWFLLSLLLLLLFVIIVYFTPYLSLAPSAYSPVSHISITHRSAATRVSKTVLRRLQFAIGVLIKKIKKKFLRARLSKCVCVLLRSVSHDKTIHCTLAPWNEKNPTFRR